MWKDIAAALHTKFESAKLLPMLHGFEISHFRNFGEDPSIVGPFGKVNIFIGANNSGKSNVLRYIRDFLVPAIKVQRGTPPPLSGINRSLFTGTEPSFFTLLFPLDEDHLKLAFPFPRPYQTEDMLRFFRSLPNAVDEAFIKISFTLEANNFHRIHIPNHDLNRIDENLSRQISHAANKGRGAHAENTVEIFNVIYQEFKSNFETKYVPAFRQVKTKLQEFDQEYERFSGESHITDDLVKFSNPTYEQQDQKEIFAKLKHFIRDITQVADLEIEIPHDRSTINVSANGVLRPLEAMGSGLHELFMLAAEIVLNQGKLVLLEEPETHLHPEFQRKLMRFLSEEVEGQFFITTHSPVIIDTPDAKVFGVSTTDGKARLNPLLTSQARRDACRELGYRASDLLQANCIIWVEGPSDRIYLNHWLRAKDPSLREGIEYSVMFYGGKLLSHLSVNDEQVSDFIQLLPINRSVAVVIDSDLGASTQSVRPTKIRVQEEVQRVGGFEWITQGREIENYISREIREIAVKAAHPEFKELTGSKTKYGRPLEYRSVDGKLNTSNINKLAIAKVAVSHDVDWNVLDLCQRISDLVRYIWDQN